MELHHSRSYGFNGPNPLSLVDIKAWSDLNGISLSPWEIETIKSVDNIYITISYEANQ